MSETKEMILDKINANTESRIPRVVVNWLLIGVLMVFVQVIVGGITRLTDSGLSITEWAVIQGTLPPMNEVEWTKAFELYKVAAKKQFESLHADMTLSEFKVIFFWEYIHRLWARMLGFVFLFPFIFFVFKKIKTGDTPWLTKLFKGKYFTKTLKAGEKRWMPNWLMKRLGITILIAMLAATFGWIMVASGLNEDNRTWVSAYKLTTHLSIATALFGYLFWTWLKAKQPITIDGHLSAVRRFSWWVIGAMLLQIVLGGLMAGMKAGLIHPHWPFFVQADGFYNSLQAIDEANVDGLLDYESKRFPKAFVQLLHRAWAYVLSVLVVMLFLKIKKAKISDKLRTANYMLITMLIIQFSLGILTVINCFGKIPVLYGSLHQGGALIMFAILLFINYQTVNKKSTV